MSNSKSKSSDCSVRNIHTKESNKRPKIEKSSDEENDGDEDDDSQQVVNKFANDGSFLEMFKKMQEQMSKKQENDDAKCSDQAHISNDSKSDSNEPSASKRKPKKLKVGMIEKKIKQTNPDDSERDQGNTSAWNQYMSEVRAYKEKYGDDGDKNRPLVK
ncbi:hypothetical protein SSS_01277 [Sarcoptes scabiei]|uniref:Uncharacterized protein n=1 Tax=Sarcoptes scabiei TaxID=52283 RepID=A0A834R1H3_SARSC|nr:hypothetical protein SSS_01277 [Sarcoptes scabiei]